MHSSMMRTAAVAAALAAALVAPAPGQDAPSHDDRDTVRSRDRGDLHPGDPLRVVGMGDADAANDFRGGLRIARRGDLEPVQVDQEEAYQRRLALFEAGARIDRPSNVAAPAREVRAKRGSGEGRAPSRGDGDASTDWIGFALAGAAAIALAIGARRAA